MEDGFVEPVLQPGQFAEDRLAANVQPRVLDQPQPALHLVSGLDTARLVARGDRRSGCEQRVRRLVPRSVQGVVDGAASIGQLHRSTELTVMGHDIGQVVGAARLQIGVADLVGHLGGCGDVVAGEFEMTRRRFDPSGEQKRAGPF